MHKLILSVVFIFLWTNSFAERDIQSLIDSGRIKRCFLSDGTLRLTYLNLESLRGIENVPNAEAVKILDLSYNQIRSLKGYSFKRFAQLSEFILNHNLIEELCSFDDFSNLREIHLTYNKLKIFDLQQFSNLSMLYVLNLGFNEIDTIKKTESDFFKKFKLKNLEMLLLNNNKIRILSPNLFMGCPNLFGLYLQDNLIEALEYGCFNGLFSLRLLYLYNNRITKIPNKIFSDLKWLHVLYLKNNNIQEVENGWDVGLGQLQLINF